MLEWIMGMLGVPLYLFEGYCIQFFFGRFAESRMHRLRNAQWAAGMAEALANHTMITSRYTYTTAPETMGSAIAAYERNIMEAVGILK